MGWIGIGVGGGRTGWARRRRVEPIRSPRGGEGARDWARDAVPIELGSSRWRHAGGWNIEGSGAGRGEGGRAVAPCSRQPEVCSVRLTPSLPAPDTVWVAVGMLGCNQ